MMRAGLVLPGRVVYALPEWNNTLSNDLFAFLPSLKRRERSVSLLLHRSNDNSFLVRPPLLPSVDKDSRKSEIRWKFRPFFLVSVWNCSNEKKIEGIK